MNQYPDYNIQDARDYSTDDKLIVKTEMRKVKSEDCSSNVAWREMVPRELYSLASVFSTSLSE